MFPTSKAVTITLNAAPDVAVAGAVTAKWVAAPADTVVEFEVPVIEAVTVSVAVMVCAPAVFSVAENVPVPLVNVVLILPNPDRLGIDLDQLGERVLQTTGNRNSAAHG